MCVDLFFPPTVWICNLHQLTRSYWKMTNDVKTCSIYWCEFSWSKLKFLWQLKQHEVSDLNVSIPQGQSILVQITRAFSCLTLVYKLGWLRVSSKCFVLYFLKDTHLGICRNGIFCRWARLFMFLASYLPAVTLLI